MYKERNCIALGFTDCQAKQQGNGTVTETDGKPSQSAWQEPAELEKQTAAPEATSGDTYQVKQSYYISYHLYLWILHQVILRLIHSESKTGMIIVALLIVPFQTVSN